jgi:hypothetical protein
MSHHTKSGQRRKQHQHRAAFKRRLKRKRAALIAEGKIKKGLAPVSAQTT